MSTRLGSKVQAGWLQLDGAASGKAKDRNGTQKQHSSSADGDPSLLTDQDIMACLTPEKVWKRMSQKASEGKKSIQKLGKMRTMFLTDYFQMPPLFACFWSIVLMYASLFTCFC